MRRYSGLDLLKFISAFGIVGCHLGLADRSDAANVVMRLTDINVGIFAAISGFFIAMGIEKALPLREAVRKRALRLLPMYFVWTGFYFVASVVFGRHFERLVDGRYLVGAIFQGGAACHLWYLIALFYLTLCVLLVNRVLPWVARATLAQAFVSLVCLYVSTLGDYTFWWGYYFARLAAFALAGMALYGMRERLAHMPSFVWLGLAIAGIALRLYPLTLNTYPLLSHKFVLDYIAALMIMPLFAIWHWGNGEIEETLADLSLGVYLIHPFLAMVIGLIAKRFIASPVNLPTMMILWIFVWTSALVVTLVARRIPGVRRFV